MGQKCIFGRILRVIASAGVGIVLFAATEASAQERVTVCSGADYYSKPIAFTYPTNRAYSVFALSNLNATGDIYINRIVIYDRNGDVKCDFDKDKPFSPPVQNFDFTKPLGPRQSLMVMTAILDCIRFDVPWVDPYNIMGTLKAYVYWSPDKKAKSLIPLSAGVAVFVADTFGPTGEQVGKVTSRSTNECHEIPLK